MSNNYLLSTLLGKTTWNTKDGSQEYCGSPTAYLGARTAADRGERSSSLVRRNAPGGTAERSRPHRSGLT